MLEKIELLSLALFDTHRKELGIVELFQKYFNASLGWHYYLDLAWIIREIGALPKGSLILDAGAGSGLLQFILSELGYNVISADFVDRSFSSKHIERYGRVIHYLNNHGTTFKNSYTRHLKTAYGRSCVGKVSKLLGVFLNSEARNKDIIGIIDKNKFVPEESLRKGEIAESCGRIFLCKCDLKEMPFLPDGCVDGIVSVSALEHNDYQDCAMCIEEMLRVTKPSGRLLLTVSASLSGDWFHEPSKGWCYSEATIKKIFRLSEGVKSNFSRKNEFFEELKKEGNELHKRLSEVYFRSGDNGMPWGKWDPKYLPVGVIKQK